MLHKWRNPDEAPRVQLFGQLKRITKHWLDAYLHCKGGTYPAQLKYNVLAAAAEKITAAITRYFKDERPITALLDPCNPSGSPRFVRFTSSKTDCWRPARKISRQLGHPRQRLESEFCRVAESHPKVRAYADLHMAEDFKNTGKGNLFVIL